MDEQIVMFPRIHLVSLIIGMECLLHGTFAVSSVVIAGTRVIYPEGISGKNLQLTNENEFPSVMQAWVDSGDMQSTPETADAPFLANPPVFRIEPKTGQTVRLMFTGKALPQDRESVFYLNTLEIPSSKSAYAKENQLLVMLRNRIKVFYRPAAIEGEPGSAPEKLAFRIDRQTSQEQVVVNNPTGYYVSIVDGSATCGTQVAGFDAEMLAPRSAASLALRGSCPASARTVRIKVRYVNDYGAIQEISYPPLDQHAK